MNHTKYQFPIDVVTREQLVAAGFSSAPDVELYEIRPVPEQNPILDDNDRPTGQTLADVLADTQ